MNLDRTDRLILDALQKDARISNKELAARVELAPSSCLERVRRLRRSGVILGYRAEISPRSLGIGLQALIAIRIVRHSRELYKTLREHILAQPEVCELYDMAGSEDFLVHVAVRDAEHLRTLAWDSLSSRDEVAHLDTRLIFEHSRSEQLPDYSGPVSRSDLR